MTKLKTPVLLAVIGAAHGIKGQLRVKSFTADPLALADYGPLHTKDGRSFEITDIQPQATVVVARFKGINDRNQAEALNGVELYVDRSALPPEDDGEFFHADLVGMTALDEAGVTLGKVSAVQNFGGGDILELKLSDGKSVLIPFTHAAVPDVDVAAGFIRVNPRAAGLVDDEDESSNRDPRSRPRGPKQAGGNQ